MFSQGMHKANKLLQEYLEIEGLAFRKGNVYCQVPFSNFSS